MFKFILAVAVAATIYVTSIANRDDLMVLVWFIALSCLYLVSDILAITI